MIVQVSLLLCISNAAASECFTCKPCGCTWWFVKQSQALTVIVLPASCCRYSLLGINPTTRKLATVLARLLPEHANYNK